MGVEIIDSDLPIWINVLIIIANIINLIYNIPQIYRTYKRKSTRDISGIFLAFRIVGNSLVLVYTIYKSDVQLSIANAVTVSSSLFMCYYKIKEMHQDHLLKKYISNGQNNEEITPNKIKLPINDLIEKLSKLTNQNIFIDKFVINAKEFIILEMGNFEVEIPDKKIRLEVFSDNPTIAPEELRIV